MRVQKTSGKLSLFGGFLRRLFLSRGVLRRFLLGGRRVSVFLVLLRRFDVAGHGRNDPYLEFRLDLVMEMDADGVQAQFLERAFEPHLIGCDVETGLLEGG